MQRGVFGFGMYNGQAEKKKLFKEYWVVDPRELHGTKAKHIEPGIVESMPKELNLNDVDGVAKLLSQVSSYTFMPMGAWPGATCISSRTGASSMRVPSSLVSEGACCSSLTTALPTSITEPNEISRT